MMKKLWVYADFDWLNHIELMGELIYEQLRGNETFGFKYSEKWLNNHGNIKICADINNYVGFQYTQPQKNIFGCFSDTLPDRWGRTLLQRREQLLAKEVNRTPCRLNSFDYLTGIEDVTRMGGLRFKESPEAEFLNQNQLFSVPPLSSLNKLLQSCHEIEKSESNNQLPDKKWLFQLIYPGSSLGGARPKANVADENQCLYVAKFPSRNDDYDVGLWEYLCNILAKTAGITTTPSRVLAIENRYHTFLSRRFDRTESGKRIHFASAMSMLGLVDGDNAENGHGYLEMVDFIVQNGANVEENLKELFRRVAFNICIGNTDDHFRNHGFLLTHRGWILSPVYDLNPSTNEYQSLLIDRNSNRSDLNLLLQAAPDYMLKKDTAVKIISEVIAAVQTWRQHAQRLKIQAIEQEQFAGVMDKWSSISALH